MRYDKLTLILLYLHFVPMAIDAATLLISVHIAGHALNESNPMLVWLGVWGIIPILLIIAGHYFLITWYSLRGEWQRWAIVSVVVWGLLIRTLAIRSNILAALHPISSEVALAAPQLQPAAKVAYYTNFMLLLFFVPVILQMTVYALYRIDYKMVKRTP